MLKLHNTGDAMRLHKLIVFSFLLNGLSCSAVTAQTFTDFTLPKQNANVTARPSAKPAMSADEYRNMVNSLNKQNQNNLSQQVTQQYGKPNTQAPSAAPLTPNLPAASPTMPLPTETTSPPAYVPPPVSLPAPNTATVQPSTSSTVTAPPVSSLGLPSNAAPQNQPYTGFGDFGKSKDNQNSNSGTGTNPPSSGGSSGWKIQY